jgi:hypothetical protein
MTAAPDPYQANAGFAGERNGFSHSAFAHHQTKPVITIDPSGRRGGARNADIRLRFCHPAPQAFAIHGDARHTVGIDAAEIGPNQGVGRCGSVCFRETVSGKYLCGKAL